MDHEYRRRDGGFDASRPGESFVEVVRGVLVEPARFFAGLGEPGPGRAKEPLIFAVICGVISVPLSFLAAPFDPLASGRPGFRMDFLPFAQDNPLVTVVLAALFILLLPLLIVLGVYVGAAIQHLFVFLFVRERKGLWGTFPVVAYGSAISFLSWIPVLGYLATLYGVYVTTVGLREMHGTSTARALLAALVPTLLGLGARTFSLISPPPGV